MIKKLKISGIWVGSEEEKVAKTGKNKGKTFKTCAVGLFTADDDKDYAGRFISGWMDKTKAEVLKKEIIEAKPTGGKEMELGITVSDKKDKDGNFYINWRFVTEEMRKDAEIELLKAELAKNKK
jgi:hypothetical protein